MTTSTFNIPASSVYACPKGFTHIRGGYAALAYLELEAETIWAPSMVAHQVAGGLFLEVQMGDYQVMYPVMDENFNPVPFDKITGATIKHSYREAENKLFSFSTRQGLYLYLGFASDEEAVDALGIAPASDLRKITPLMQEFKGGKRIINANAAIFAAKVTDPDFRFKVEADGVFEHPRNVEEMIDNPFHGIMDWVTVTAWYKGRSATQIYPVVNGIEPIARGECTVMDVNRTILRGLVDLIQRLSGYGAMERESEQKAAKPAVSLPKAVIAPVPPLVGTPTVEPKPSAADQPEETLEEETARFKGVLEKATKGKRDVQAIVTLGEYFGKLEASIRFKFKDDLAFILGSEISGIMKEAASSMPKQALQNKIAPVLAAIQNSPYCNAVLPLFSNKS